jgi:hypothetical protein
MEINHALSERAIGHYGCIGRTAISHQRLRDAMKADESGFFRAAVKARRITAPELELS